MNFKILGNTILLRYSLVIGFVAVVCLLSGCESQSVVEVTRVVVVTATPVGATEESDSVPSPAETATPTSPLGTDSSSANQASEQPFAVGGFLANLFIVGLYYIALRIGQGIAIGKQFGEGSWTDRFMRTMQEYAATEGTGAPQARTFRQINEAQMAQQTLPDSVQRVQRITGGFLYSGCLLFIFAICGSAAFAAYYFATGNPGQYSQILLRFAYWLPFALLGLVTDMPFRVFDWKNARNRHIARVGLWWIPRIGIVVFMIYPPFLHTLDPVTTDLVVLALAAILAAIFGWAYASQERVTTRDVQDNYSLYEETIGKVLSVGGIVDSSTLFGARGDALRLALTKYVTDHAGYDLLLDPLGTRLECRGSRELQLLDSIWPSTSLALQGMENEDPSVFVQRAREFMAIFLSALQFSLKDGSERVRNRMVSQIAQADLLVRLPKEFPIVCLQKGTYDLADFDDLRHFLIEQVGADRFAIAFSFIDVERAQELAQKELRLVHNWDVVVMGLGECQHILMSKEKRRAMIDVVLSQVNLSLISPFVVAGPPPENMFAGRDREIRQLVTSIRSGSSVSIAGGRKIGKTSILQKMLRTLDDSSLEFFPIYISFESVRSYREFFRVVDVYWERYDVELPLEADPEAVPNRLRQTVLEKARTLPDKKLVLLFDEVDLLLEFDINNSELLFKAFRALAQEGTCAFVFTGEKLLHKQSANPTSPLFNFCTRMTLGYLEQTAMEKLIFEPMRFMGVDFEDSHKIMEEIWTLSSGHPNIVQWICSHIVEQLDKESVRTIRMDHVVAVRNSTSFQDTYIDTIWGRAEPLERAITLVMPLRPFTSSEVERALSAVDIHPSPVEIKNALDNLVLFSILTQTSAEYTFLPRQFPAIAQQLLDVRLEIEAYRGDWLRNRR